MLEKTYFEHEKGVTDKGYMCLALLTCQPCHYVNYSSVHWTIFRPVPQIESTENQRALLISENSTYVLF